MCCLTVFILIGYLLFAPVAKKFSLSNIQQLFSAAIIGLVVSVTLFSIWFAGFKTINTGFLLLFILFYFQLRSGQAQIQSKVFRKRLLLKKHVAPMIMVFLMFFAWEATMLFKGGTFHYVLPHDDFIYYSNVSESLLMGGRENFFMEGNFTASNYQYMNPYHYFEIWLNTMIVWFTGLNNMTCFMLVGFPVLYFFCWLGVLAFMEQITQEMRVQHYIFSILVLFTGGLFLPFFNKVPFLSQTFVFAPFPLETTVKKYATFYPFILAATLLFVNKRYNEGLLTIMSLGFVSITAFPGIFGGVIIFLLICFIWSILPRTILIKAGFHLLLISLFISLTYFYFNQSKLGLGITDKKEMTAVSRFFDKNYLKTFVNVIGGASIQTLIVFLPLLTIAFFRFKSVGKAAVQKPIGIIMILFLSIITCSLLTWAFLWQMPNSAGFYASSLNYLNILFIILLFYTGIDNQNLVRQFLGYGFFGFLLLKVCFSIADNIKLRISRINLFSDSYINNVENIGQKRKLNPVGCFIVEKALYKNSFDKNTFFRRRGGYLKFLSPYKFATNINILDAPISSDSVEKQRDIAMINLSVFNQFVNDQKKAGAFKNKEQSQLDFIDRFRVDYLIADHNAELSYDLLKRVDTSIQDPVSGEHFLILHRN